MKFIYTICKGFLSNFDYLWFSVFDMDLFTVTVWIIKVLSGNSDDSRQAAETVALSKQSARVFRFFSSFVELLCLAGPIATSTFCSSLLCLFSFFILAQGSWEQRCFVFLNCKKYFLSSMQVITNVGYLINSQILLVLHAGLLRK